MMQAIRMGALTRLEGSCCVKSKGQAEEARSMLTIFSTPKPFLGHIGVIQRNALQSWKLLHPDVEIVLFGNDEGAAEVCREFGLRHEPEVLRSALGTKRLDSIFGRAQEIARHETVCY